jgi:hypothetical protein
MLTPPVRCHDKVDSGDVDPTCFNPKIWIPLFEGYAFESFMFLKAFGF